MASRRPLSCCDPSLTPSRRNKGDAASRAPKRTRGRTAPRPPSSSRRRGRPASWVCAAAAAASRTAAAATRGAARRARRRPRSGRSTAPPRPGGPSRGRAARSGSRRPGRRPRRPRARRRPSPTRRSRRGGSPTCGACPGRGAHPPHRRRTPRASRRRCTSAAGSPRASRASRAMRRARPSRWRSSSSLLLRAARPQRGGGASYLRVLMLGGAALCSLGERAHPPEPSERAYPSRCVLYRVGRFSRAPPTRRWLSSRSVQGDYALRSADKCNALGRLESGRNKTHVTRPTSPTRDTSFALRRVASRPRPAAGVAQQRRAGAGYF